MGIIEDKKKFKTTKEQDNPLNPEGTPAKSDIKKFDIDKKTIKKKSS